MGGPSPRRDHNTRKAEQVSWLAAWLTLCAFPSRHRRDSGLCRFQRRSQLRGSNGLAPGIESPDGAHHFPSRVPRRGPLGLTYSLVGMALLHATKTRAAYVVEADGEVKRFVEIRRPENSKGTPVGMPLLLKPKQDRVLTRRTTSSSPRPSSQEPGPERPEPPERGVAFFSAPFISPFAGAFFSAFAGAFFSAFAGAFFSAFSPPSSQEPGPEPPEPERPEPPGQPPGPSPQPSWSHQRKTRRRKRTQRPEPEPTRSSSSFSIHLLSDRNSKRPDEKIEANLSSNCAIIPLCVRFSSPVFSRGCHARNRQEILLYSLLASAILRLG